MLFFLLAGDSDGSFGGDIEPSIFNNPALFEDAANTLAEGLSLPNEPGTAGTDEGGGVKEAGEPMMGVEVITSMGPKSNGATPQVHNQQQQQPVPPMQSNQGPQRTDSGAFALMPIDVPVTAAEPRRYVYIFRLILGIIWIILLSTLVNKLFSGIRGNFPQFYRFCFNCINYCYRSSSTFKSK